MAEVSGITELQLAEAELGRLKKTLADVQKGEDTSKSCAQVVNSIKGAETRDGFLMSEGAESNPFYTSAGPKAGEGGCCVVL